MSEFAIKESVIADDSESTEFVTSENDIIPQSITSPTTDPFDENTATTEQRVEWLRSRGIFIGNLLIYNHHKIFFCFE